MPQALPHSVTLSNQHGATAVVSEYGAQVLSWKPAPSGNEVLFLSKLIKTVPEPGSAIRGGIPILFPQFGGYGTTKRQHGFARNFAWEIVDQSERGKVTLRLVSSEITHLIWPHDFELHFTVELGAKDIYMQLSVYNSGAEQLQFTTGLHNYFAIEDISKASLHGLFNYEYLDNLNQEVSTEVEKVLTFSKEIDRIYRSKADAIPLVLDYPKGKIEIHNIGFNDAVVWNPWQQGANAIADLENDDYQKFVCVESVCVSNAVDLEPGGSWRANQTLKAKEH